MLHVCVVICLDENGAVPVMEVRPLGDVQIGNSNSQHIRKNRSKTGERKTVAIRGNIIPLIVLYSKQTLHVNSF